MVKPNITKRCCIALCDRPQNYEIYSPPFNFLFFFYHFSEKKYIIALKTEKYQPKERRKKGKQVFKKIKIDRPIHFLAPKGQYNIFFLFRPDHEMMMCNTQYARAESSSVHYRFKP